MNRKIAVAGLKSINNFGDNILMRCVSFLVEKREGFEAVPMDLEPPVKGMLKVPYYGVLILSRLCPQKNLKHRLRYASVKIRCGVSYRQVLSECAGLIFTGGSFKYSTQKCWAYYCLVIEIAEKAGIPVMFNAMNIERFDGNDSRCVFLADHAGWDCVKVFTTRDGPDAIRRLRDDYKLPQSVICAAAGDGAFWMDECYDTKSSRLAAENAKKDTVGINLIDGDIFIKYKGNLTRERLLKIYLDLIKCLDENGVSWELYTNGHKLDYEFGRQLLNLYGNPSEKIRVPSSDDDLANIVVSYSAVVAARLHSSICAYVYGIPFCGFIWDEKLKSFAEMSGAKENFVPEDSLTGENLFRCLEAARKSGVSHEETKAYWKEETLKYIDLFLSRIS